MENPEKQVAESVAPVEDPPPPAVMDQSTSESLGDSSARRPPPPLSPLTGCYLLIVIGEPHSDRHKEIILQKVAKGRKFKIFHLEHSRKDLLQLNLSNQLMLSCDAAFHQKLLFLFIILLRIYIVYLHLHITHIYAIYSFTQVHNIRNANILFFGLLN